MSRIGKAPVYFDKNVQVTVSGDTVSVKGGKHALSVKLRPTIKAKVEDGKVVLTRVDDLATTRAYHGLSRALVQNAVTGVTKGWSKELELNGVGYRATLTGKRLELVLGYSHPVVFEVPEGIEVKIEKQTKVMISGPNRDVVGKTAAKIRSFRPPEPYLGKGIKYTDERIMRKEGKSPGK